MDQALVLLQRVQNYIDNFRFEEAPLSSFYAPVIGSVIYLLVIFSLKAIIKKPIGELKAVVVLHNLFLCILSALMLVSIVINLIPFVRKFGAFHVYCDNPGPPHPELNMNHGGLAFWCYIFYVSKYYEMVDTLLLVLKARPLTLVHVYHHFIVPYLFWIFLQTETTGHWILAFNNSLVHVLMYWYYMVTVLGYDVWWKKYLTIMQIIQFFVDMFVTWPHLLMMRALGIWDCRGSMQSVYFGQLVGISFIFLFTSFYRRTYTEGEKKAATHKKRE